MDRSAVLKTSPCMQLHLHSRQLPLPVRVLQVPTARHCLGSSQGRFRATPAVQRSSRRCLTKAAAGTAVEDMSPSSDAPLLSSDGSELLQILFDNNSDPQCTVVTVEGKDKAHLLITLTGALSSAGLKVISASIQSDEGKVLDVFHVQNADGKKVPESDFDEVRTQLLSATSTTSRSSMPAIYGIVAAAEVERLKPLMGQSAQNDVDALELAGAEMAQAAAELVAMEREIIALRTKGVDARLIQAKESARTEAAANLERKMAAMEAVLAARRNLAQVEAEKPEPKKTMEKLIESFKPAVVARGAIGPGCGSGYEIMLQGFNWESHKHGWYRTLHSKVKEIADAGFTCIWMPPPSDSVSPQGYLPRDLYQLDCAYGSEQELRDLIKAFHDVKIKVIADIVVNHRCANNQGSDGKWNKFGGRLAWDASAICSNNPAFGGRGNPKQGDDYAAAPNIDHTQERIRNDIKGWLKFLRNSIGFDGWRLDFVRGYLGQYVKEYVDETVPELSFGEYWDACEYTDGVLNYNQDAHRQRTINWCDSTGGTAAAFDFTTKGILQEAVGRREYWRLVDNQGRPPGVMGLWPSRAITFIDNHDTGSTLNHWPFPANHVAEGYAYLLTHPGTPCVFWDHLFQWGEPLKKSILELIEVRQRNGINARSKVAVRKTAADVYGAIIDDKIAMKIGPGDWTPNTGGGPKQWKVTVSGPNFAVWERIQS